MAIILWTNEGQTVLPEKMAVCPCCDGKGKSSAYLGTFSHEDMMDDPEFFEDYRAGNFDRTCARCDGLRVVAVLDDLRCTREQLEAYHLQELSDYQDQRMQEMESGLS